MTFYQELQLNQAGSKSYILSLENPKDKIKHTVIYLFKILLTISFCTVFIVLFCALFGTENSITGLAVLLSIMVFRNTDLGIRASHGAINIFIVFAILAAGSAISNQLPAGWAFLSNSIFIMLLMIQGYLQAMDDRQFLMPLVHFLLQCLY